MRIIQLLRGYFKGDGVGNVVTSIEQLLTKFGYDTETIDVNLGEKALDDSLIAIDDIVLYHVALNVDPFITYLKCRKILVFHNITPPDLLMGSSLDSIRIHSSAGLYDVGHICDYFEAAIVFSDYSKETLISCGWSENKIWVIPIMVRFDNLSKDYSETIIEKYKDKGTNILFTGRIFPNKKQEDIIKAFNVYKKKYDSSARLFLVGGIENYEYYDALRQLVSELDIEKDVMITGKAPFDEFLAYYRCADVFLCMSAHEGFCIPLVEAMYFNIPIVAVKSTAVTDTMNGCGCLLETRDYEKIAENINILHIDKGYREDIITDQKRRLDELMPGHLEKKYQSVFNTLFTNKYAKPMYRNIADITVCDRRLSYPQNFKSEGIIVYGVGQMGQRLIRELKGDGMNILYLIDKQKAGGVYEGYRILSPEEATSDVNGGDYIISIQNKRIIVEVTAWMVLSGIHEKRIFVYDDANMHIL